MRQIPQKLEELQYKKFVSRTNQIFKSTDTLYQKCVRDESGKKYFINMWYYPKTVVDGHTIKENVQPECQFTNEDGVSINVEVLSNDIEYAEQFFEDFWQKYRCEHYE